MDSLPILSTLTALEMELHHPGVPCSLDRLEQLLHPDFHEVGRSGQPYDRATVLRVLGAQSVPPPVESWGFEVQLLAETVALLTFRSARVGPGGWREQPTHRASIWMRTDEGSNEGRGRWRLRYHQGTPAADGSAV